MVKHRNRAPTRAQKMAETKRLKAAGKVFLDFHHNTSWANDKLASGTPDLSPQAVVFMETEIRRRKDMKAHEDELAAQNKAADLAAKEAANREAEL